MQNISPENFLTLSRNRQKNLVLLSYDVNDHWPCLLKVKINQTLFRI